MWRTISTLFTVSRPNRGAHDGCATTKCQRYWQLLNCKAKCAAKSRRKRLRRSSKLRKKKSQMNQVQGHRMKWRQPLNLAVSNTTKSWPRKNKMSQHKLYYILKLEIKWNVASGVRQTQQKKTLSSSPRYEVEEKFWKHRKWNFLAFTQWNSIQIAYKSSRTIRRCVFIRTECVYCIRQFSKYYIRSALRVRVLQIKICIRIVLTNVCNFYNI